jgi:GAF domain-containing protein/predicted phosphodiesterase
MSKKPKINKRLDKLFQGFSPEDSGITPPPPQKAAKETTAPPQAEPASARDKPLSHSAPPKRAVTAPIVAPAEAAAGHENAVVAYAVNIKTGYEDWSTLLVMDEDRRDWSSEEELLVKQVSDQLSLALENARLFQEAQRRAEELAFINRVVSALAAARSLQEALGTAIREIVQSLPVSRGAVGLLDESGKNLEIVAEHSKAKNPPVALGLRIPLAENFVSQQVISSRKPFVLENAFHNPALSLEMQAEYRRLGIRSSVIFPIIINEQAVGTLGVDIVEEKTRLGEGEIKLLETVLSPVSAAISRLRAEEDALERANELAFINRVVSALTGASTLREALELVSREIVAAYPVARAGIAMMNEDKQSLTLLAGHTKRGEPSPRPALWVFNLDVSDAFTVSGTVTVDPPVAVDALARFRIAPYLTRVGPDTVTVSWETDHEAHSVVVYGSTPGCEKVAVGELLRNQTQDVWDPAVPNHFTSFFHTVTLSGLEPNTRYFYRVLSVGENTVPEAFTTANTPGQPFTFGLISDTQQQHLFHERVVASMSTHATDFYLHAGDLVHNSNSETEWLKFFAIEAPLLKNRPFFPAIGNHDLSRMELFFFRYFGNTSLGSVPPELQGRVHSFNYGNSHFVLLDSNLLMAADQPVYQWLEQDLAQAQADPDRKFTFVVQHHPVYSAFEYGQFPANQTLLAPLYQAHDVDAVFSGHVHLYERDSVNGRVFITAGGGGGTLDCDPPNLSLNPYYVTSYSVHHFIIVNVWPKSFDLKTYNIEGVLLDQVHYSKP